MERRDYTKVISHTTTDYVLNLPQNEKTAGNQASEPRKVQNTQQTKRYKVLGSVLLFLAILSALGFTFISQLQRNDSNSKDPYALLRATDQSAYVPNTLPTGYTIDSTSIRPSKDVLFYSIKGSGTSNPITFSFQPLPNDFNAGRFVDPLSTSATIPIPMGTAYNLGGSLQTKYMVVTKDSLLVFINSAVKVEETDMKTLLESLQPL